jgi:hypothetical protein
VHQEVQPQGRDHTDEAAQRYPDQDRVIPDEERDADLQGDQSDDPKESEAVVPDESADLGMSFEDLLRAGTMGLGPEVSTESEAILSGWHRDL